MRSALIPNGSKCGRNPSHAAARSSTTTTSLSGRRRHTRRFNSHPELWSHMPNRRTFLKSLAAPAAVAGFPTIIPATALGYQGTPPPSDRVALATIGTGWMGGDHVGIFLKNKHVQYVAICDVDDAHAQENKAKVDKTYGNNDCVTYRAFEELLSRKDIDAVSIGVPDHWHGIVSYS